jgi:phosphoglycerate dehydrogenase-like enzyme
VLVTGSALVPGEVRRYIEGRGYAVRAVEQEQCTAAELHAALDGVSGYLIGGSEMLLDEHVERAHRLRAVAFVGTDFRAHVPAWRCVEARGIAMINTPGANAHAVAEFTLLLILLMQRPMVGQIAACGGPASELPEPGRDLRGARLGIVGLGRIGTLVARTAGAGFGMRVSYTAPRRAETVENALGIEHRPLSDLLAWADVISLHCPGPTGTESPMIGRTELAALREGALLVNTIHPGLVHLGALADAASTRGIRAAFDGLGAGPDWDRLVRLGPARFLAVPTMGFHTGGANLAAGQRAARSVCDLLDRER